MIDKICSFPVPFLYGLMAVLGALSYSLYTIYHLKKEDPEIKIELPRLLDTFWQAAVTGYVASQTLSCGYFSLIFTFVSAIGVDKIANKLKISGVSFLNILTWIAKYLEDKDR